MSTPAEDLQARTQLLACLADFELAMEDASLTIYERELMHANVLVCRLVTQLQAMLERRVAELQEQVAAALVAVEESGADEGMARRCEQWQRELHQIPRMAADLRETMLNLMWPTRPLALALPSRNIALDEPLVPFSAWIAPGLI